MANLHTSTKVPVDDEYVALVGKAIYVFAYYEWSIIWIVEFIQPGFVQEYSRARHPMTSGAIKTHFQEAIEKSLVDDASVSKGELEACLSEFDALIIKRNALIHAHPVTDVDGAQVLAYQTNPSRPLPDMKWQAKDVIELIASFDKAAVSAGQILDRMRQRAGRKKELKQK